MIEQIRLVKTFQMQCSPLTAMATTQAILCEVGTDATLRHHEADIITLPSIQYDKRIPALPMMMSPRLCVENEKLKQLHSEREKVAALLEQTLRRELFWPRSTYRHESMAE